MLNSQFFLGGFCSLSSRLPCLVGVFVLLMIVGDHLVKVYSMSRRDVKRGASIENSRIVKSVKFSVLTPILHILDISGGVTG